jgi:hypothetical protein
MTRRRPRRFAIVLLVLGAALAGGTAGAAPVPGASADVSHLVAEVTRLHPSPFHDVDEQGWRAAAASLVTRADGLRRDELVVEVMRLIASLGEREGHSGLFPGTSPGMRFYPLQLYDFSDGLFVIAGPPETVGRKVVAVEGLPIADVVARVRPLVSRDNDWSARNLLPWYLVTADVLSGLGIAGETAATFTLQGPQGRTDVTLAAGTQEPQHPWTLAAPPGVRAPLFVRKLHLQRAITVLDRGRVVYVTYNGVGGDTQWFADQIRKRLRAKAFRRLIVDARMNGGGNNQKNAPIVALLRSKAARRWFPPVVITGRATFSAGKDFVVDAEAFGGARLVGEPSGGALKQWGDAVPVQLERSGLVVFVATSFVSAGRRDDLRRVQEPHVPVQVSSADWFAGRDPVLEAALRVRR